MCVFNQPNIKNIISLLNGLNEIVKLDLALVNRI